MGKPGVYQDKIPKIAVLFREGKTVGQICNALNMPYDAVYYHVGRILGKEMPALPVDADDSPEPVDKSPETVDTQTPSGEIPPVSVYDDTAAECFKGLTVLSLPERGPEPPPPTIAQLREGWSEVHQHDQAQAAVAAKILRFLDGIKEEFKDEPELADRVAHQGVAALEERYREVQAKRRLEAAS